MKCPVLVKGCGGCTGLNTPYGDLVKQKEAALSRLFPNALPLIGAEDPRRYRNKVLRTFADGKDGLYCGIYRRGTHQALSVQYCCLENPSANEAALTALRCLRSFDLRAYREDTRSGLLRHMVIRIAPVTGQMLLTLVTTSAPFPRQQETAQALMEAIPALRGVIRNINDRPGSAVMGFHSRLLAGRNEIWDEMGGIRVCLSSGSFYQVNHGQAEKLYRKAIELANLHPEDIVVDAYCGVGIIGMLCACHVQTVTGSEISAASITCAEKAKKVNCLANIQFRLGEAEKALAGIRPDVVFVDPPREGLRGSFLRALGEVSPRTIVYISCNPVTLKRDTGILSAQGYAIASVQGVDLFPYTEHVETVVRLSRQ